MAKVYEPKVKAAVPKTPFTAKKWVADSDEANEEGKTLFETKSQELDDAIGAVRDQAGEELKKVQKAYDDETNHSKNTVAQKLWSGKFEKSFKKARKPKVTK